ncbi:hypothetical protein HDU99_006236 [Rhizoclosmatium hyalinum]|nr:hypothetical protein HDU99_006236 [Rhizoclosmatium hyalinum]
MNTTRYTFSLSLPQYISRCGWLRMSPLSTPKRLQQAPGFKSPSLGPESPTPRTVNHKKSDQRRREALKTSFSRLLAVIPQASPLASPTTVAAHSASPPSLADDDDDDADEMPDGSKAPNRVETMQLTIKYIHSLKEKNDGMDNRINQLRRELDLLRSAASQRGL